MDAHIFRLVTLELSLFMRGGRVEKIFSPAPGLLAITIYNFGVKRIVTLRHDKAWNPAQHKITSIKQDKEPPALYLTTQRLPNPEKPSTLVMTLRKYLVGHRLGAATTDWLNRRIYFFVPQAPGREFSNSPPIWFCLDLLNGPSLQSLLPEIEAPRWPGADILAPAHHEALNMPSVWKNYPVLTPPLRKTLVELDGPEALALLADLEYEAEKNEGSLYQYNFKGTPHLLSAWPLPPSMAADMEEIILSHSPALKRPHTLDDDTTPQSELFFECTEDFPYLEASREVHEPRVIAFLGLHLQKDQLQEENGSRRRLNKTLQKLEQEEARLKGLVAMREQAALLQGILWKYSRDEKLEEIRIAADENPNGHEELITLDSVKTLRENMAHMFKQSRRGLRGLEFLSERRKTIKAELQSVMDGLILPPTPKTRQKGALTQQRGKAEKEASLVQRFTSSDGFIILRGKSAKGNHVLLKLAQPHDLWLHVEGGPSAHVIIRRANLGVEIPEHTLHEAGILSGVKSWRKHDNQAEIITALVKDVRPVKGGAPGSAFVNKQQKSFIVTLDHELEESLKQL